MLHILLGFMCLYGMVNNILIRGKAKHIRLMHVRSKRSSASDVRLTHVRSKSRMYV